MLPRPAVNGEIKSYWGTGGDTYPTSPFGSSPVSAHGVCEPAAVLGEVD